MLAAWAERMGIKVRQANHLVSLAAIAAAKQTSKSDTAADRVMREFEIYADALGFQTCWPGLYPVLVKDGIEFTLPD
jgi:hypothetical protein